MYYQVLQDMKTVMELLNLSMEDLAKNIGVSRITIYNWLKEKSRIKESNVAAFYEYAFRTGVRLNKIKEQLYREDVISNAEVLLFHGAKNEINGKLRLDCSRKNNDFGQGFYCGENIEQSAMFVSNYPNASLYMMKFDRTGLRSRKFGVTRDWMLTIAYHRGRLKEFADSGIIKNLIAQNNDIDYIVAPIADNRMFEIIDSFANGEMTDIQCQHCLSATNLGNQYVFITEKALEQIEILEKCFLAQTEKESYLNARQESYQINQDKVKIARRQYRNQGKYIEDILV